jgi:hypothetical protein
MPDENAAADGEVVWSWRRDRGVKSAEDIPPATVARNAAHRGEHEISRKTIARGKPGCPGCTCSSNPCAFFRTRGYGRSRRPAFPAPSSRKRDNEMPQPGRKPAAGMHTRSLTRLDGLQQLREPAHPGGADFSGRLGAIGERLPTRKSIAPGSGTSIASGQYACEGKNS